MASGAMPRQNARVANVDSAPGALEEALEEIARLRAQVAKLDAVQTRLRESEDRYRALVDACPFGIAVHTEGKVRFVNRAAVTMLGAKSPSELVGIPVMSIVHPDDRAMVASRVADVYHSQNVPPMEERFLRRDGTVLNVEVAGTVGRWNDQPATQTVFIDISERKRMHQERATLEQQLRQTQKLESLGRLAGGVAHDFNNLLTGIMGYAELLLGDLQDQDQQEDAAQIVEATKRGADLTRQLLAFSMHRTPIPEVFEPQSLVQNLSKFLQRLLGEDVQVQIEHEQGGMCIAADKSQIEQIIMNLAVNAQEAMPKGGKLSLRTTRRIITASETAPAPELEAGEYWQLLVQDTGCGMSAETIAHIFEPFFTTKDKGTGLGLSTVYGIAHQHGGAISVQSVVDEGTTFCVWIPLSTRATSQETLQARPASMRGTETILLVEDDRPIRDVTERTLLANGYRVHVAEDGEQALALIESKPQLELHLLITDVIMPKMNGEELCQQVRDKFPGLPVIYVSGFPGDALGARGVRTRQLLTKPFTQTALLSRVRQTLRAPKQDDASL